MTSPQNLKEALSIQPLLRLLADFANSRILDAAIEYDFFTLIHQGFHTHEEIAREAGTDPRATRIVLDGLIALALVEKRAGRYFVTPASETFLVRGKPDYIGDFRYVAMSLWDGMAHLRETLKTGKPFSRLDTGNELQVWEKLVIGIIPIVRPAAEAFCEIFEVGKVRTGLRVLDVAGGSSIFGHTILRFDPSAEVTQLDWPNVNAVAQKFWGERGSGGKIRYIDGEFRTTAVAENYYDLVIASNFCRFESPQGNRDLFLKAFRALRTGGFILINDFLPNEERTGPTFALRFSVYVLTHTPSGECYTLSQYSRWLEEAGFDAVQAHGDLADTLAGTTLILALKK